MRGQVVMPGAVGVTSEYIPPIEPGSTALFLDVDGTLLEYASTPEEVSASPATVDLLRKLSACVGGALALVSGRRIASLDHLFAPLRLPAAGLHGLERRSLQGSYVREAMPPASYLARAHRLLRNLCREHPELLIEDKQFSVAIHYRNAPHLADTVHNAVRMIQRVLTPHIVVEWGRMVAELRPPGASKATALSEFMAEPPFAGRVPVMVGDDKTDEVAFRWVNLVHGVSIAVSPPGASAASFRLGGVPAVHAWLRLNLERVTANPTDGAWRLG